MQVFELQGELRTDLGKKATNLLRAEGKVPCVLYGGKENVHFSVVEKDLQKLLYTPVVYIVKVNVAAIRRFAGKGHHAAQAAIASRRTHQ